MGATKEEQDAKAAYAICEKELASLRPLVDILHTNLASIHALTVEIQRVRVELAHLAARPDVPAPPGAPAGIYQDDAQRQAGMELGRLKMRRRNLKTDCVKVLKDLLAALNVPAEAFLKFEAALKRMETKARADNPSDKRLAKMKALSGKLEPLREEFRSMKSFHDFLKNVLAGHIAKLAPPLIAGNPYDV